MATFAEIVTRVELNTGRSDKTTVIQTRLTDTLQELQRLQNRYFMEEIATRLLVEDQQDYKVPADFKDIKNIYLLETDATWGNDPLDKWTMEEGRQRFNADDTGDPTGYSVYREGIWVWPPKPDAAAALKKLHLEYFKYLAVITGAGSNELTLRWPDLVETWTTWKFYSKLPNSNEEAIFWRDQALIMEKDLTKYSNDYRMKAKVVMRVRTSPRQRDLSSARPFGGR